MGVGDARTRELPVESASVGAARRFVVEVLGDSGRGLADVVWMTSELVSNVVEHVASPIRLTVSAGPPVRVEVHDHQAATDVFRELVASPVMPGPEARQGRGLAIVRSLSSRLGLDDDPYGVQYWVMRWEVP